MAEDWLADVRRYDATADEGVVAAIVRHCGIAVRTRDASLASFSASAETDRVRDNYLKKKLALGNDNAMLDAGIAAVGQRMAADPTKNRVTLYYLLAQHFDRLIVFGVSVDGVATVAPAAAAVGTFGAASTGAAAVTPQAAPQPPGSTALPSGGGESARARPTGGGGGNGNGRAARDKNGGSDMFGIGCIAGVVALGAILGAALVSLWTSHTILSRDPLPVAAAVPAAPPASVPSPATPAEIPDGAGVLATERDGKPMLTVYFHTGKADVAPDFDALSADILTYLEANPAATVAISGFNDPTGDAALNEDLSRNRAQNVQAALAGLGVAQERTELVKPEDATATDMDAAAARRVEIVIVD